VLFITRFPPEFARGRENFGELAGMGFKPVKRGALEDQDESSPALEDERLVSRAISLKICQNFSPDISVELCFQSFLLGR
jgi:hypothetical protein